MNAPAQFASPRIVFWLGYGGLVPFLAFTALTFIDRERQMLWHDDLQAYAAVILSFVGALHWGFAMRADDVAASRRNAMFAWSVIPSLAAFLALAAHSVLGDVLLLCGFVAHYCQDLRLAAILGLPAWYLPLRLRLSLMAILSVAGGAFAIR